jgi:hypothetical protein
MVVKVAASSLVGDRIPNVLRVTRWLEVEGFLAVRLVHDLDKNPRAPVATPQPSGTASPPDSPPPTGGVLARLARRLHDLPAPPGLPPWDPIRSIRRRLADADGPNPADLAFLADRSDAIEAEMTTLNPARPHGPSPATRSWET